MVYTRIIHPEIALEEFTAVSIPGFQLYTVVHLDAQCNSTPCFEKTFELLKTDFEDMSSISASKNFLVQYAALLIGDGNAYITLCKDASGKISIHCLYRFMNIFHAEEHPMSSSLCGIPGYTQVLIVPK